MNISQIMQASLNDLAQYCLQIQSPEPSLEDCYAQVLLAFLRSDLPRLTELTDQVNRFREHPDQKAFETACQLRLAIRRRRFEKQLSENVQALFESLQPTWKGELALLQATHFTVEPDFLKAKEWFRRAYQALLNTGFTKKALRARLNELVTDSHIDPDKNQLSSYHDLYRWCLQNSDREDVVALTCLINISREYQRAGAYLASLQWCEKGLKFSELQFGSAAHHLLLAQKADVLLSLNRLAEARLVCDELTLTPFPEVKAALEVILPKLKSGKPKLPAAEMLPTWKERLEGEDKLPQLSRLEDQLVEYLSGGPKDRFDLIDHLYGASLSYETKLNRLKSLLSTLRRKSSDLVRYRDGRYELADQITVPRLRRAGE